MKTRDQVIDQFKFLKVGSSAQYAAISAVTKTLLLSSIEIFASVPAGETRKIALQKLLEVKLLCQQSIIHDWPEVAPDSRNWPKEAYNK